jgi:DnaJ-class molecular chaperone
MSCMSFLFKANSSGVTRLSSAKSIKAAYRRAALASHPDKVEPTQREAATKKFQDVQVAYDTLQDPVQRRNYDAKTFGPTSLLHTPPNSTYGEDERRRSWYNFGGDMPPTPDSPNTTGSDGWWRGRSFDAAREFDRFTKQRSIMTLLEASLLFRPEDRRHLWLGSEEDDPAYSKLEHLTKGLYVSLQEYSLSVLR